MIKVEGPDTRAAIMRARDHTPETVPLILETAVTLLLGCPLACDNRVHRLKQSRRGAESYGLYLDDGRQVHFRPWPPGHGATSIRVYDRYKDGELVAELDSREAIWHFFAQLKVPPA